MLNLPIATDWPILSEKDTCGNPVIPKTITITHLGAQTCVTGSCHLVQFQPDHAGPAC